MPLSLPSSRGDGANRIPPSRPQPPPRVSMLKTSYEHVCVCAVRIRVCKGKNVSSSVVRLVLTGSSSRHDDSRTRVCEFYLSANEKFLNNFFSFLGKIFFSFSRSSSRVQNILYYRIVVVGYTVLIAYKFIILTYNIILYNIVCWMRRR